MSDVVVLAVIALGVVGWIILYDLILEVLERVFLAVGAGLKAVYIAVLGDSDESRSLPADVGRPGTAIAPAATRSSTHEPAAVSDLEGRSDASMSDSARTSTVPSNAPRFPSKAADVRSCITWVTRTRPSFSDPAERLEWGVLVSRAGIELPAPETVLKEVVGWAAVCEAKPEASPLDVATPVRQVARKGLATDAWEIEQRLGGMSTIVLSAERICIAIDDPGTIDGEHVSDRTVAHTKIDYEHVNLIWLACQPGRRGTLLPTSLHLASDGTDGVRPFEIWFEVDGLRGDALIPRKVDGRAVFSEVVRSWAAVWLRNADLELSRKRVLELALRDQWRRVDRPDGESVLLIADTLDCGKR